MKVILTPLLLFFSTVIYACQWDSWSFCHTCDFRQSHTVFSGVITDTIPHGIKLRIIDLLRGTEQRDTVTIWDGTDFDCNGIFSMAARQLGLNGILGDTTLIGDTIIVVLPVIDSMENTWDVIGDYRRPDYFGYEPGLWVKNDTVVGYIAGPYGSLDYELTRMGYSSFKSHWIANTMKCYDLVEIEKIENILRLYPTIVNERLMIEINATDYSITIFSGNGLRMIQQSVTDNSIDMSGFSSGLYIVELRINNEFIRKKILKL